jgi:inorganic pyrophosphatase
MSPHNRKLDCSHQHVTGLAARMKMIKVLIQVAAGSRNMSFYDETTLKLKRIGRVAQPYPYPYGFILNTRAPDGDNIDCYVLTTSALCSGNIVECEPAGLLQQQENGEIDDKVLAILPGEEVELNEVLLSIFKKFIYRVFSKFPETDVKVGEILPRQSALDYIRRPGASGTSGNP